MTSKFYDNENITFRHHAQLNENMIILHAMNYEYITLIKRCHCPFFKPKGLSDHQKVIIIQNKEFETQI